MSSSRFIIAGYGELVYDHIFVRDHKEMTRYEESRGGGPVWNVLANLASFGIDTIAIGVGGNDQFGRLARSELSQLGVRVDHLSLISSKRTRIIFEQLNTAVDQNTLPKHRFSSKCLICGKRISQKNLSLAANKVNREMIDFSDVGLIYMDRLRKDGMKLLDQIRKRGAVAAVDLGRVGDIRYVPAAQIARHLSMFDIVMIPDEVARSLKVRAGFQSITDLLDIGLTSIICVTKGAAGASIYLRDYKKKKRSIELDSHVPCKQVDSAGAGDFFMSRFLYGLIRSGVFKQSLKQGVYQVEAVHKVAQEAIDMVKVSLATLGARGHLPRPRTGRGIYEFTRSKGKELEVLRSMYIGLKKCPVCELPRKQNEKEAYQVRKRRNESRMNIAWLLRKMLFTTERHAAIERCQELLNSIRTAYIIGTGGSFSAAVFIAFLMSKERGIIAQSLRPYDYIRTAAFTDCLVVVSHSGATKDCANAIQHAIQLGVPRIIVVTGALQAKLSRLLRKEDDVISYGWKRPERGFVSIAGTVCPCALWTAAHAGAKSIAQLSYSIENKINNVPNEIVSMKKVFGLSHGVLDVFGGGFSWPAMVDIESKFVEGGIGIAQLHESKDFSHGRFISILKSPRSANAKLFIRVGRKSLYEDELAMILRKAGPLIEVISENEASLGGLEVLIEVQFIIQKLAELLKLNISRPKNIPTDGLRLYRWKQRLF